jgi:hypothetical protein
VACQPTTASAASLSFSLSLSLDEQAVAYRVNAILVLLAGHDFDCVCARIVLERNPKEQKGEEETRRPTLLGYRCGGALGALQWPRRRDEHSRGYNERERGEHTHTHTQRERERERGEPSR